MEGWHGVVEFNYSWFMWGFLCHPLFGLIIFMSKGILFSIRAKVQVASLQNLDAISYSRFIQFYLLSETHIIHVYCIYLHLPFTIIKIS